MAEVGAWRGSGVAIVTGGGRGIGAAVAKLAGAHGYTVLVNYARDGQAAQEVVAFIKAQGGTASAFQADVSEEREILRLFAEADRLGPLSALVNNAGMTGGFSKVENLQAGVLQAVLATNVVGSFLCAREAVRRMSTAHGGSGGVIVNVSSRAAELGGGDDWVHYAASKGALGTLTVGLAREVADEGIRVNAVAPGLIETELHAAAGAPDRPAKLASAIPMKRPGHPDEVAEAILWLMSPLSAYITGSILSVSGGR